jgi:hypothetical protein
VEHIECQRRIEELHRHAAALRNTSRELAQVLSDTAASIARTYDYMAHVHDAIATNPAWTRPRQAQQYGAYGARARRPANHEDHQQQPHAHPDEAAL